MHICHKHPPAETLPCSSLSRLYERVHPARELHHVPYLNYLRIYLSRAIGEICQRVTPPAEPGTTKVPQSPLAAKSTFPPDTTRPIRFIWLHFSVISDVSTAANGAAPLGSTTIYIKQRSSSISLVTNMLQIRTDQVISDRVRRLALFAGIPLFCMSLQSTVACIK
jgi:hypothetical protein